MTSLALRPRRACGLVCAPLLLAACPGDPTTSTDPTDSTATTDPTSSGTTVTPTAPTTEAPTSSTAPAPTPSTGTTDTTDTTTTTGTTGDPDAPALWIVPLLGAGARSPHSVALAPDGHVLVAGAFTGTLQLDQVTLTSQGGLDLFLLCFTRTGELLWAHAIGGPGQEHEASVSVAPDGRILLAGEFGDTVALPGLDPLISHGATDILLLQLGPGGDFAWARGLGGPGVEMEPRAAFDPAGDILVSAMFETQIDLGGGPLVAGGARDLLVARFDGAGEHVWSKSFPNSGDISNHDLAVAATGDLAITGWYGNDLDLGGDPLAPGGAYVVVLDGDTGAHRWSRTIGDGGNSGGCGARFAGDGGLLLTGWFQNTADFGGGPITAADHSDYFVARYDESGAFVWASGHGGASVDSGCAVGAGAQGDWIVGGDFTDQIDLGGGPLTKQTAPCGFLASLADDGAHRWSMPLCAASGGGVRRLATYPEGHVVFVADFAGPATLFGETIDVPQAYGVIAHVPVDLLGP